MKNEQRKSAEQRQLSNATQAKLFANQKHLHVHYNRLQWLFQLVKRGVTNVSR